MDTSERTHIATYSRIATRAYVSRSIYEHAKAEFLRMDDVPTIYAASPCLARTRVIFFPRWFPAHTSDQAKLTAALHIELIV